MTFWDKRFNRDDDEGDLPEELRGKSPKEVAAALKKAKEDADKLAAAELARTEAEGKVTARDNEFEQMKTRMAELEANQKPAPVIENNEPPSIWEDPAKFVQDQTRDSTSIALQAGLMAAKMYFQQGLTARDQKIFKKYEKEVSDCVATFAPQARVVPQGWMNAFLYVKGGHEQDISKAESSSTDFFSETPSRGHQDEPAPDDKLTDEEAAMCRSMHWDPVAYLERKKKGTTHSSAKGAYAKFSV